MNKKLRENIIIIILFLIVLALFASKNTFAENEDFFGVKYEYMDNQSTTEETNLSNVTQKKIYREAGIKLDYYFHFFGDYKNYESSIKVGAEEIETNFKKSNISGWIPFFDVVYISALNEDSNQKYRIISNSVENFRENEKISFSARAFGLIIKKWNTRIGYNPESIYQWEYKVGSNTLTLFEENTKYKLRLIELVKKPNDKVGFYSDLYFKKIVTKEVISDLGGGLNEVRYFFKIGYGFNDLEGIYFGSSNAKSKMEMSLISQSGSLIQESNFSQSFYGIEIPVMNDYSIKLEKQFSRELKELQSDIYYNMRDFQKNLLTLGFNMSKKFLVEVKAGKTTDNRASDLRLTGYSPAYFKLVDSLVGVSIKVQFSNL